MLPNRVPGPFARALKIVLVLVVPPLWFARRRKWGAFAITSLLYGIGLLWFFWIYFFWIYSAWKYGYYLGAPVWGFIIGGLFWLACLAGILLDASAERRRAHTSSEPSPLASVRSRFLEAALIVAWPIAILVFFVIRVGDVGRQAGYDESLITEAAWEAEWIIEHALLYRRVEGRKPGSIAELRRRYPGAEIEGLDPWGRPWVLSPAFQDTRQPKDPGDLWVCSRGPEGQGRCPSEDLKAVSGGSAGSVGYSVALGAWQPSSSLWFDRMPGIVAAVLGTILIAGILFGPYPVYRLVRRMLGRPAPPLKGVLAILFVGGVLLNFLFHFLVVAQVHPRWRVERSKARADLRVMSDAIVQHRAHMDSLPVALTDLTLTATNRQGRAAGPFIGRLPTWPAGGQYVYKRSPGGRYLLKFRNPSRRMPTVLCRSASPSPVSDETICNVS